MVRGQQVLAGYFGYQNTGFMSGFPRAGAKLRFPFSAVSLDCALAQRLLAPARRGLMDLAHHLFHAIEVAGLVAVIPPW
jgi:hypothetical protein